MRRITLIIYFLVLVFGASSATGQVKSHIQMQFDGFYQFLHNLNTLDTLSHNERAERVQTKYNEIFGALFGSDGFSTLSKDNIHLLFEAAFLASFENPEGSAYQDALKALHSLGPDASDREIRLAQGMLFQSRKFDELDALSSAYAARDLMQAPDVETPTNPALHQILVYDGSRLTTKVIDIGHGPWLVVVAHPLCHFTRNAMTAIEQNSYLKEVMGRNSVWISPPDQNMDFTAFSKWADVHPEAPIFTAYAFSSWPQISQWGTPTFYFFLDGKVVDKVVGWPKGGRMNDLKKGLTRIGLIKARL